MEPRLATFTSIVFNLPKPFEKYVQKAWKHGHIHIGTVTEASIFYTTKYALKGLRRKRSDEVDEHGREPQFQLMSNGLGVNYVKQTIVEYLRTNGSKLLTVPGGAKKKLPRYYVDKMFTDPEEKSLWTAAANAEISINHNRHDIDITDKQRRELIELYDYRNKRDRLNSDKI